MSDKTWRSQVPVKRYGLVAYFREPFVLAQACATHPDQIFFFVSFFLDLAKKKESERQPGEARFLCHRGPLAGKQFESKTEMLTALEKLKEKNNKKG